MKLKIILVLSFLVMKIYNVTAQNNSASISGLIKDKTSKTSLPYINVVLKTAKDQKMLAGTVTNEEGRFNIPAVPSGNYILEISSTGYKTKTQKLFVGSLSDFLDLNSIDLEEDINTLSEVIVTSKTSEVSAKMDKKVFSVADNITQSGGSVLQSMQSLPGVTLHDGKVQLRGNDKVMVLIDGKQTALTGFGNQSGLDNIPASAIEKIEIINNPSAKFDANGNAGIINIIYKKNKQEGFNGKVGITSGYGALWERKANLPTIRPQYQMTPKINPSLSLNYRKEKINAYVQADYLYTETLNKNEFVTRTYDDGTIINQQTVRNRNTHFTTFKSGIDWNYNDRNSFSFSGLFGSEKIIDNGDEPFFNQDYSQRLRLWSFLEDELKTTLMASASYEHKFSQPGHKLNAGINYTYHREDEKYFFTNTMPDFVGQDSFKLLSDEKVIDINLDYIKPLKYGRFETGFKFRNREIPTNMQFFPGQNSPIDTNAGGWANYKEIIPALYSNYIFESNKIEAELGLRLEYVKLQYDVNPNHPTYKSDGYNYTEPFPNMRFGYKIDDKNKITAFYNRRVDRPAEVDIRIFPKYDDAEIIKVGNPALRPQFTNTFEVGYKKTMPKGYFTSSIYYRIINGTIARIATTVPDSNLIYNVFQNADKSSSIGIEAIYSNEVTSWYSFNVNGNLYQNTIDAFTVTNLYPIPSIYVGERQQMISGNLKWNNTLQFSKTLKGQVSALYLAPDVVPQGKIDSRFSVDLGIKKTVQKGKGEVFVNATDIFNTLVVQKEISGNGFSYNSKDYYETQVIRFGYSYKF
ncbi:TonB-dependent receptor domain-containing protein [Flavobacterium hibernum]|uniref:TonB-dependent receptor n=1 Tax=Flavobacterium hibernum TaxID=37752 RepID=A0A0D0F4A9_9FLAO|nr:TonB-dependent receptor [Flavobacterium hibernum]KIO54481.1 TonB-dependent receptor [Flavobacterium hibernum]OXA88275.1 TonB-dependent receptor [Flavobacterium hibernum]STO10668.1 vitamin B12/cobalamin outer membrane transporter [Flavobacterium hibernum]